MLKTSIGIVTVGNSGGGGGVVGFGNCGVATYVYENNMEYKPGI